MHCSLPAKADAKAARWSVALMPRHGSRLGFAIREGA
jgi:hypothetical protein